MSADTQIIKSWRFWAGVIAGIALTLLVLTLLGRLKLDFEPAAAGATPEGFAERL